MKHTIFRLALTAELAWLCGGGMACLTLPAAYAQRGCMAIGGEWLLILAAGAAGAQLALALTKTRKKARR